MVWCCHSLHGSGYLRRNPSSSEVWTEELVIAAIVVECSTKYNRIVRSVLVSPSSSSSFTRFTMSFKAGSKFSSAVPYRLSGLADSGCHRPPGLAVKLASYWSCVGWPVVRAHSYCSGLDCWYADQSLRTYRYVLWLNCWWKCRALLIAGTFEAHLLELAYADFDLGWLLVAELFTASLNLMGSIVRFVSFVKVCWLHWSCSSLSS